MFSRFINYKSMYYYFLEPVHCSSTHIHTFLKICYSQVQMAWFGLDLFFSVKSFPLLFPASLWLISFFKDDLTFWHPATMMFIWLLSFSFSTPVLGELFQLFKPIYRSSTCIYSQTSFTMMKWTQMISFDLIFPPKPSLEY